MNKGWLELESDPGLFTLLLQDFGVKGVQVEEIYDLQKPIEGPAYGFIFLFRWIEERRSRRKTITEDETFLQDENIVNSIFFAQQMIPNSCATHALLSVLLNCEKVNLGETLSKLKIYSRNMNPENKGYAIGNMPELAKAHNSHARKEPAHLPEKQPGMTVRRMEAFHFVSYVPISGRLFELDGLKPFPIDHGPWDKNEDWTEKFRRVISERLGMATGGEPYHDIRFNLMAVVPDKRQLYEHKLSTLKTNRQIVLEALQQLLGFSKMVKVTSPAVTQTDKEKCLAAVQKRDDVPLPSTSTQHTVVIDQKPVIIGAEHSAKIKSETDVSMSETKGPSSHVENVNKVEIKIETEEKMEVDTGAADEKVKMEIDAVAPSEKKIKSEVTVSETGYSLNTENHTVVQSGSTSTGSVVVSNDKGINSAVKDSDTVSESKVQIQVSISSGGEGASVSVPATVSQTDVTKPLTIQTKFTSGGTPNVSPGPSSESTDTASEVGSCFSSPSSSTLGNSAQNSPNVSEGGSPQVPTTKADSDTMKKSKTKFSSQQGFKPKDLLALLKNVENEIKICENNLRDEQEKMNKYKIDDCRRTHNYDQFLCTFLSMLAEQGHLAELVQQHSNIKKRVPGTVSKVTKVAKVTKLATNKKKKNKPKKRR